MSIALSSTIRDYLAAVGGTVTSAEQSVTIVLDDDTWVIGADSDGVTAEGTSERRTWLLSSRHLGPVEKYLALHYGERVRQARGMPASHFLSHASVLAPGFTLDGDDYFGGQLLWVENGLLHRFKIPMTPRYDRTAAYLSQVFRFDLEDITDTFLHGPRLTGPKTGPFSHRVPGFERPFRLPAALDTWMRQGNDVVDLHSDWVAYGQYTSGGNRVAVDGDVFLVHKREEKSNDWNSLLVVTPAFDVVDAYLTTANHVAWRPEGAQRGRPWPSDLAPGFTTTPHPTMEHFVVLRHADRLLGTVIVGLAVGISHILAIGGEEARRRVRAGIPFDAGR
ncbi:hypothetical protein [Frigoribacterium sp. PhB24]|uniref:hypothetical protein n=1 Tax=Frigoribacterium sp. PhB24 TaxID=2485204 RepID=UPI000F49AD7A|nr:hypothetical protein [Frigoribacterium sp. PhB24]ROS52517.1 hypothetical protein EDF50_0980 [Frigoribacterium sp. PhB24]